MKLLYFAWVRERIGRAEETRDVPATVKTVADLMIWLGEQGPEYHAAFSEPSAVRAAINQQHVTLDGELLGATEIAFFPPVTGG
ncbi:MAG: molybdopterin converting factor subunit 1 [Hyphomicrobiaceae bacterium]